MKLEVRPASERYTQCDSTSSFKRRWNGEPLSPYIQKGKRGNLGEDLARGDEFAESTVQRLDFVVPLAKALLDTGRNVLLLHPFFVTVDVEHMVRDLFVVTLHFARWNFSRKN